MSRARMMARLAAEASAAFDQDVADGIEVDSPANRKQFVEDRVHDALQDAEADAAHDREVFGIPEDSPCIQSCDFYGTGEGQYHGVIQ
jgi:hypothetical protein